MDTSGTVFNRASFQLGGSGEDQNDAEGGDFTEVVHGSTGGEWIPAPSGEHCL